MKIFIQALKNLTQNKNQISFISIMIKSNFFAPPFLN